MFKHVPMALLLCALAASLPAREGTDRDRDGLVGPVHVVRQHWFDATRTADGYKADGQPRLMGSSTYDTAGNYLEQELMDDYGFPIGKQTFHYRDGRVAESRLVDTEGVLLERRTHSYEQTQQNVAVANSEGIEYLERYLLGPRGRWERIVYFGPDHRELGRTVLKYDNSGDEPIEMAFFTPDSRPATAPVGPCLGAHRIVHRYAGGRVKESELFEEDGRLKRKSSFKYDEQGNVTEELRTGEMSDSLFRYTYRYDDRGNWIERIAEVDYDLQDEEGPSLLRVTVREITYY